MSWLAVLLALSAGWNVAFASAEHCSLPRGAVIGSVIKDESGQLAFSTSIDPGACHFSPAETCMLLHEDAAVAQAICV